MLLSDKFIDDHFIPFVIFIESFGWLFIVGRVAPLYWDPVMVFLGSYLVADIIFKVFISVEKGHATSPITDKISNWIAKTLHRPIKRVIMNRGEAYLMFTMTIIISSGIATIIQVVLETTFKLSDILKRENDTLVLVTSLSLLVSMLLWLNFYHFYTGKKETPNQPRKISKEKSGSQPRKATRRKKSSSQK